MITESKYMQGKIIKGIAGFYYVNVVESGIFECKAKGAFRKDGIKPLVGDDAVIEVLDEKEMNPRLMGMLASVLAAPMYRVSMPMA